MLHNNNNKNSNSNANIKNNLAKTEHEQNNAEEVMGYGNPVHSNRTTQNVAQTIAPSRELICQSGLNRTDPVSIHNTHTYTHSHTYICTAHYTLNLMFFFLTSIGFDIGERKLLVRRTFSNTMSAVSTRLPKRWQCCYSCFLKFREIRLKVKR